MKKDGSIAQFYLTRLRIALTPVAVLSSFKKFSRNLRELDQFKDMMSLETDPYDLKGPLAMTITFRAFIESGDAYHPIQDIVSDLATIFSLDQAHLKYDIPVRLLHLYEDACERSGLALVGFGLLYLYEGEDVCSGDVSAVRIAFKEIEIRNSEHREALQAIAGFLLGVENIRYLLEIAAFPQLIANLCRAFDDPEGMEAKLWAAYELAHAKRWVA